MLKEVEDKNFQKEVLEKSKEVPVVVDFWSPWCMPCLMLGPVLEKLAAEYKNKFVLVKARVDQARKAASKYKIMSIPSVKLFKKGEVVAEFVGALSEKEVRKWLEKNL